MLTIDSLLKDANILKEQFEEMKEKKEFLPVKRLNDDIEVKCIDVERIMDLSARCTNNYSRAIMICYEGISQPNLKDKELWKSLDVSISNPYEIVKKIFRPYEILEISEKIGEISGINEPTKEAKLTDQIKN
jgi:hypothetical protein